MSWVPGNKISVSTLKGWRAEETLYIPDIQRGEIWTRAQRQGLIHSVLKDYPIPPLVLARTQGDPDRLAVWDGQQKLSALLQFPDDGFPISSQTAQAFGIPKGLCSKLPPWVGDKVRNYVIRCDEISGVPDEDLEEFYLLVQSGSRLKPGEILKAVGSPLQKFSLSLLKHPFFTGSVSLSTKHQQIFSAAAKASVVEVTEFTGRLNLPGLKKAFRANKDFSPADSPQAMRLTAALDFLAEAFPIPAPELTEQCFVQSVITLAAQFVAGGKSAGHTEGFANFVREFYEWIDGPNDGTDELAFDHQRFRQTYRTDLAADVRIRHDVLVKRMRQWEPGLATLLGDTGDLETARGVGDATSRAAKVFAGIVVSQARKVLRGASDVTAFKKALFENRMIMRVYPEAVDRSVAIERYGRIYEGRQEPLDSIGNLTHDTMIMMGALRLLSTTVENALKDEIGYLIYTDSIRQFKGDTYAKDMRRLRVYTLKALERRLGYSLPDDLRILVIEAVTEVAKLETPKYARAKVTLDTGLSADAQPGGPKMVAPKSALGREIAPAPRA